MVEEYEVQITSYGYAAIGAIIATIVFIFPPLFNVMQNSGDIGLISAILSAILFGGAVSICSFVASAGSWLIARKKRG